MYGNTGVTIRIVLLIITFDFVYGCQPMPWYTDPDDPIEEWLELQDRTVYNKLTLDDIINIVDSVMYDVDDEWPGEWSNDCYERMTWFHIEYYDSKTVEEKCQGESDTACIYIEQWLILVSREQDLLGTYESLGHEFVHHIGNCLYLDRDSHHENPLLWRNLDPELSIEARIHRRLWEETRKEEKEAA